MSDDKKPAPAPDKDAYKGDTIREDDRRPEKRDK